MATVIQIKRSTGVSAPTVSDLEGEFFMCRTGLIQVQVQNFY